MARTWIDSLESNIRAEWARYIRTGQIRTVQLDQMPYVRDIVLGIKFTKDSTPTHVPRLERQRIPLSAWDDVEQALNERRRELTRQRVAKFRAMSDPLLVRDCPALGRAKKVRTAVGLFVEPLRCHPLTSVHGVVW